jgi:hypothetical protein
MVALAPLVMQLNVASLYLSITGIPKVYLVYVYQKMNVIILIEFFANLVIIDFHCK